MTNEVRRRRQKLLKRNAKRRNLGRARRGKENCLIPFFMTCLNIDLTEHVSN